MQPKNVPTHIRIKHAPTLIQRGRACRLYGKDFHNMASAARYWDISLSWVREQVDKNQNSEEFPPKARKKYEKKRIKVLK